MINNMIVIYQSKTGFTKKYAEWIAEELHCEIRGNEKFSLGDFIFYDTIIFGGGLYASGINGIKLIKDNFNVLKNKNIIIFATGLTPPRDEDIAKVWEANFSEEQRDKIKKFYLRGGFDFSKLSAVNKMMMSMMKLKLKGEKEPSEDAKGMLEAMDKPVDFTDKENIKPLISCVLESKF